MPVTIRQMPQRDSGTGRAQQREEPETFTDPSGPEPTGFAEQESDEVTYQDLSHEGEPTGAAQQQPAEVTVRDAMTVALREQADASEGEEPSEAEPAAEDVSDEASTKKRSNARNKKRTT
jgi:hypothetical protein